LAYVSVPKDLTVVKTKVMFNLTKRQLICFGAAAAIGVPAFFISSNFLGTTAAVMVMIVLMLPAFFVAMYEKDGQPAEKILLNMVRAKLYYPSVRPYTTENFYSVIEMEGKLFEQSENAKAAGQSSGGKIYASGKTKHR
jgi:hypothetical protein